MNRLSAEQKAELALQHLRARYPETLEIRETTPANGGFRLAVAKKLIARGDAVWVVQNQTVRATRGTELGD